MTPSDPDPHADSNTPPHHELNGHELTPMETFFDNLFNQHMVLPQPPEEPPPIEGVD
jgi:hypothetical protein